MEAVGFSGAGREGNRVGTPGVPLSFPLSFSAKTRKYRMPAVAAATIVMIMIVV